MQHSVFEILVLFAFYYCFLHISPANMLSCISIHFNSSYFSTVPFFTKTLRSVNCNPSIRLIFLWDRNSLFYLHGPTVVSFAFPIRLCPLPYILLLCCCLLLCISKCCVCLPSPMVLRVFSIYLNTHPENCGFVALWFYVVYRVVAASCVRF